MSSAPVVAPLEFDVFFAEQRHRLAAAIYLLTGSKNDAEDLAQEALARAFERWDRVRVMESAAGYVYRIALNLCRKRWKRIAREQTEIEADALTEDDAEVVTRRVAIHAALRALSVEQREALVLVEWLELSSTEAGDVLGISAESVRARAHRAREALRKRMGGLDE